MIIDNSVKCINVLKCINHLIFISLILHCCNVAFVVKCYNSHITDVRIAGAFIFFVKLNAKGVEKNKKIIACQSLAGCKRGRK